jgi:hypothetical protein
MPTTKSSMRSAARRRRQQVTARAAGIRCKAFEDWLAESPKQRSQFVAGIVAPESASFFYGLERVSERERTKVEARESLSKLMPFGMWFAAAPRTAEDVEFVLRIRAELRRIASHGYDSTIEIVTVNGIIKTINGIPFAKYVAAEEATYEPRFRE